MERFSINPLCAPFVKSITDSKKTMPVQGACLLGLGSLLFLFLISTPCVVFSQPAGEALQWSLGTRLQIDRSEFNNDQNTALDDSWNTRRARLSGELRWQDNWLFDLTYDFARDGISGVRDAYVEYRGFPGFNLRAGHFKEPFSGERLTSTRDLAMMERSLATAIAPRRSVGIAMQRSRADYTLGWGLFSGRLDQSSDITDYSVAGRATIAPRHDDGNILHAGFSLAYRHLENGKPLKFDERMETRGSDFRLIDTGDFLARDYWLYSAEFAYTFDNLSLQAEFIQSLIPDARRTENTAGEHLQFAGWHIDASWIITGEAQPYNQKKGTLGRIKTAAPVHSGGIGTWKAGVRVSEMNLNDGFIHGGHQRNLTASLTWLLDQHFSFIIEHVKVLSLDQGEFDGAAPSLTQGRVQIVY